MIQRGMVDKARRWWSPLPTFVWSPSRSNLSCLSQIAVGVWVFIIFYFFAPERPAALRGIWLEEELGDDHASRTNKRLLELETS